MLNSLQILRGLAAWLVVFTHINIWFLLGYDENIFWALILKIGQSGVDIFFVISGVVMALVARKYQTRSVVFLMNRIYRVVPIYWFYTLIMVICLVVFPVGVYATEWSAQNLLKSLFFVPYLNLADRGGYYPLLLVGWSLIYEMFFYAVFFAVLLLRVPKPTIVCSLLLLVFSLINMGDNFLGYGALLLMEFTIGIWIYEYLHNQKVSNSLLLKLLPVPMFCGLILGTVIFDVEIPTIFFFAGFVVYVFILSETLLAKDIWLFNFLRKLGDYSYSTYLCHIIIIGWFFYLFGGKDSFVLSAVSVVAILILTLVASSYSYRYLERNSHILKLQHWSIEKYNSTKKNRSELEKS